jgi:hypothetical protein
MNPAIVPIVEGQSEEKSVPVLLRRILHERLQVFDIEIAKAFRIRRDQIVNKDNELGRAIAVATAKRENVKAILILLDADNDCPAAVAQNLLKRAEKTASNMPIAVVLAKREFESWFLGCKEVFQGFKGIAPDAMAPDNAEDVDGKGRLKQNMRGTNYDSAIDQVRFVQRMDFDLSRRRCRSFDKLLRDIERLVTEIKK